MLDEMTMNFSELYTFTNRIVVSLKTKNNIMTRGDFSKIRSICPEGYKIALDISNRKNLLEIPSLLQNGMDVDYTKLLSQKNIDRESLMSQMNHVAPSYTGCLSRAKDMVEGLRITETISDATILPASILTGLVCSSVMQGYSMYIQHQYKNQNLNLNINEAFDNFSKTTREHIMRGNEVKSLNEVFSLGIGEALLVAIGYIYLQAAIAYVLGVDLKRKWDILKYALPGMVSMTILSVLMAIVINVSIF